MLNGLGPHRRSHLVQDRPLGGSSGKFTFRGKSFLVRLQRAEFASCINQGLRRGYTSVLAGAGCAISGEGLRRVAARDDRDGPWCYDSLVEDYELTYRLREMGYRTQISPTVRAYTDPMKTNRALYSQRMKWSTGMIQDLLRFGLNRLTVVEWSQMVLSLFGYAFRILWLVLMVGLALIGQLHFSLVWWVALPALFIAVQVRQALRIPHRDKLDLVYAFAVIPMEVFTWLRFRWFFAAWSAVLLSGPVRRLMRRAEADRWRLQYAAETWSKTLWHKMRGLAGALATGGVVGAVLLVLVGAAIPSLGVPNFGARLGLPQPGTPSVGGAGHTPVTVRAGYRPPTTCLGYVALTYDDGPTAITEDLADHLRAYGLHATFFLLGGNVNGNPQWSRYLVDHGMWVGAHTMTHPELPTRQVQGEPGADVYGVGHRLTVAEQTREIVGSANAIEAATGIYPDVFRPPYGYSSKNLQKIIEDNGMNEAFWTVDTEDWKGKTVSQVANIVVASQAGDVILMHDDAPTDVETVQLIAEGLAKKGLCTGQLVQGDKEIPFINDQALTSRTIVAKP